MILNGKTNFIQLEKISISGTNFTTINELQVVPYLSNKSSQSLPTKTSY